MANTGANSGTITLAGGTATIIADKDTNALIITATQRTQKALETVLTQLDIRTPQVLIEAIIAEVQNTNGTDLGVNWVLDGSNVNFGAAAFTNPVLAGSTSSPLVDIYAAAKGQSATIPNGAVFGVGRLSTTGVNFAAVLQALQSDSRNNIVAKPQVLTLNNLETKITVARKVPFVTGQYTGTTGTTSAFQTIQREEVGTLFTVTPRITKGDRVALKISVESSAVESQLTAGAAGLVTKDNTIATSVLIRDGDWLVLGGMIQDTATATEARVPLLGRIPLLGELFRTRSKSQDKRNLMVFIKPTIIHDDEQAATSTKAKYDILREQQKQLNRETTILPLVPFRGQPTLPEFPPGDKNKSRAPKPDAKPDADPNSTPEAKP
jgi:general secretion pathway protein D